MCAVANGDLTRYHSSRVLRFICLNIRNITMPFNTSCSSRLHGHFWARKPQSLLNFPHESWGFLTSSGTWQISFVGCPSFPGSSPPQEGCPLPTDTLVEEHDVSGFFPDSNIFPSLFSSVEVPRVCTVCLAHRWVYSAAAISAGQTPPTMLLLLCCAQARSCLAVISCKAHSKVFDNKG